MLAYLDSLEVFDRSLGLNPFLLLDGHSSRFELDFLEYINKVETKWVVNIGLPYGTSYWQVGDSTEQNGCFKMALVKQKQALVTKKNDHGLPYEINKTDVVKLVKDAWRVSFARPETNRKAVLQRGWGPRALNYNCLLHEEIMASKPSIEEHQAKKPLIKSSLTPSELNLSGGLAGTLIDRIVAEKNKEGGALTIDQVREKRRATARQSLENHEKRCSAGLIAAAGRFGLDSNFLAYVRHAKDMEEERVRQQQLRKKDIFDTLRAKVQDIRDKNLPPEKWTVSELNTMLQWYKNPSDTAMPSKKSDKLARYHQICNRGDPPEPELLPLPPLPTPQLATASTEDAVPDLSLLDDNSSTLSDLEDNELLMRINEMLTSATEV
jgi:hypothetical protein